METDSAGTVGDTSGDADDDDGQTDPSAATSASTQPGTTTDDPTTDATSGPGESESSGGPPTGGPAGSCGMGGGKNEILQIELGSPERWYLIGAPDTDEPLPLVLAFHGDEGDPFKSTRYIWGSYWEESGEPFIAVMTKCPGCTSWYMGDTSANADYVWEVLADVATNHNVDVSRIYAVGFSGGSEFLSLHGFEFQDVFAGIQWTCGGNAYGPYTEPSRPDCKVHGRIVISADDFLWDGAQNLLARLEAEGHEHEFVEAQCSGHCCSTPDHNEGAWAWFQTVTKCDAIVPGMCAEIETLPPMPSWRDPGLRTRGAAGPRIERPLVAAPEIDFAEASDRVDAAIVDLEALDERSTPSQREAAFAQAMGAYDTMLALAHRQGPQAKAALQARYPRLRALMAALRR
jgi:hypothetical protein